MLCVLQGRTYLLVDELINAPQRQWYRLGRDSNERTDAGELCISFFVSGPKAFIACMTDGVVLQLLRCMYPSVPSDRVGGSRHSTVDASVAAPSATSFEPIGFVFRRYAQSSVCLLWRMIAHGYSRAIA